MQTAMTDSQGSSSMERMRRLMDMQRGMDTDNTISVMSVFGGGLVYSGASAITRQELEKVLDTDTMFRWLYIPFVVAEIMWDRIDTLLLMAPREKVDYKKECRQARELKHIYDSSRQTLIQGMCISAEKEHTERLIDEFDKHLFKHTYKTIHQEVRRWNPELDDDTVVFISAAHEAWQIYLSVCRYTDSFQKIIYNHFGFTTRNVMPTSFNKFGSVIKAFCKAGHMLATDNPVLRDCVSETVGIMFDIQLFNEEGPTKEKIDYSKYKY